MVCVSHWMEHLRPRSAVKDDIVSSLTASSSHVALLRQAQAQEQPDGVRPGPCSAAAVHDIGGERPLIDGAEDLAGSPLHRSREADARGRWGARTTPPYSPMPTWLPAASSE